MKNTEKNLDNYLQSPFNIGIYNALTTGLRKGLFTPIEFFRLIEKERNYFRRNSNKYLLIESHFRKYKLQGEQRFYFFWILCTVLTSIDRNNDLLNSVQGKSIDFLKSELQKIDDILHGKRESTFDFWRVLKHCDSLPNETERIKYLLEMETFCKQTGHDRVYPEFIPNCELEILRLKSVLELNKDAQIPEQNVKAVIPYEPSQASDFHKIMIGAASLKFAEIEQQLHNRGYIDKWKEGKDKQSLCGLLYLLDTKSFFSKVKGDRAKLSAARRFFETRYGTNLKAIFRKSKDPKHQASFKSFVTL